MNLLMLLIIILVCLFAEGFFSGSELALVVADKIRLKNRADKGDGNAITALKLISSPLRFFSTTLFGTNTCVVTASTALTYYIIKNYGEEYSLFALLLSPVILVLGEMVPKSIYQHHADTMAPRLGVLLSLISKIFYPFVWCLSKITKMLLGDVRRVAGSEARISREELAIILSSKEVKESDMPPEKRKMIRRVLGLADLEVKNIMIPIVEVQMVPVTSDIEGALAVFDLKGLSRLPVFDHRAYNIIGIIDIVDCIFEQKNKPVKEVMQEVIYVPENMPLYELYETLRNTREEMAVVVDEYGGATGIVTFEDLLEEIVGEIRDEYEFGEQRYRATGPDQYIVSGRMEIEEANEKLKLGIPKGEYETVAGYVLELFGYIPKSGEAVSAGGWNYRVTESTNRAVLEIEVGRVS